MERLIYLISEENSHEEIDKFIKILKFLHNCEILTLFNMNILKFKIEKQEKLTPKLYSFFLKINATNSQIKIQNENDKKEKITLSKEYRRKIYLNQNMIFYLKKKKYIFLLKDSPNMENNIVG